MAVSPHAASMYRLKTVKGRQIHRMRPSPGRIPRKTRQELAMVANVQKLLMESRFEEAQKIMDRLKKIAERTTIRQ